ncbi:sialate O-acetylesterase [Ulvibacterium marinum]|uniref:sialate O-acetylesterase n=1 Tax=Ulvibacterium marinum TaxID=2419782 RepID=UPI00249421D3|nr:sialate O-acetylesterase [Ulvibacterium marinum]
MKSHHILVLSLVTLLLASCNPESKGKHLFILSGQSNMVGLLPEESFTPVIEARFGKDKAIIVKDAHGGQPIRRWYKDWKPLQGKEPKAQPDLYDSLWTKIRASIHEENIATATFIWMQGERDAREKLGNVYEKSLIGLYDQLSADLKRNDLNFIIGRLSDFDMQNERYPHWTLIREIQVKVAESDPRFGWIDTDDLNDGYNKNGKEIRNDLHMSEEGYIEMGKRFAQEAILRIED